MFSYLWLSTSELLRSTVHLEILWYRMWDGAPLHSFHVDVQLCQHHSLQKPLIPNSELLGSLQNWPSMWCVRLISGYGLYDIVCMPIPMLGTHSSEYCSSAGNFETWKYVFFHLFWLFIIAISKGPTEIPCEFCYQAFYFCKNGACDFHCCFMKLVDHCGNIAIPPMLSLTVHEDGQLSLCQSLCLFFNLFQ